MSEATHIYCESCGSIQPIIIEPLTAADESNEYLGGDLLCCTCHLVITTIFKVKT